MLLCVNMDRLDSRTRAFTVAGGVPPRPADLAKRRAEAAKPCPTVPAVDPDQTTQETKYQRVGAETEILLRKLQSDFAGEVAEFSIVKPSNQSSVGEIIAGVTSFFRREEPTVEGMTFNYPHIDVKTGTAHTPALLAQVIRDVLKANPTFRFDVVVGQSNDIHIVHLWDQNDDKEPGI